MNFIARLLFGVSRPEEIDVNSSEDFNDTVPAPEIKLSKEKNSGAPISPNPPTPRGFIQPFNRTSANSTTPNNKKAILKDNWIFEDVDDFDYDAEFGISLEDLEESSSFGNKVYSDINIFKKDDINLKTRIDSKRWAGNKPSIDPQFVRRIALEFLIFSVNKTIDFDNKTPHFNMQEHIHTKLGNSPLGNHKPSSARGSISLEDFQRGSTTVYSSLSKSDPFDDFDNTDSDNMVVDGDGSADDWGDDFGDGFDLGSKIVPKVPSIVDDSSDSFDEGDW